MSIQVPSPSYGSVAGGEEESPAPFAGSSELAFDRSDDPGRPPADPTTSGEPIHAESPTTQSSAHAHATIDLMHHPPAAPVPENRERPERPKVRVPPARSCFGRVRFGSPGGWGRAARMGAPRRTLERTDDGRRRHHGGSAARTLL